MPHVAQRILVLAALVLFSVSGGDAWGKGGRGGGRGGGWSGGPKNAGISGKNAGRQWSSVPNRSRSQRTREVTRTNSPWSQRERAVGGDQRQKVTETFDHHHNRELRKLDHRQRVSDHLRSVSERNGNENLLRVADDMDRRALSHYDKQMRKFGTDPAFDGPTEGPLSPIEPWGDSFDAPTRFDSGGLLPGQPTKLTGRENAVYRQVRNAERKLAARMETVQRMRQIADANGDQTLLDRAARMEQWALDDFDRRLIKIEDFQQRHGLLEMTE